MWTWCGEVHRISFRSLTRERMLPKGLPAAFVRRANPGHHHDEHGLILRVLPTGARQRIWRVPARGKRVCLGYGGYASTSSDETKRKAVEKLKPGSYLSKMRLRECPRSSVGLGPPVVGPRPSGAPLSTTTPSRISTGSALPKSPTRHVGGRAVADTGMRSARLHAPSVSGSGMKWAVANGYREDDPAADAVAAASPQCGERREHFPAPHHTEVAAALLIPMVAGSGEARGTRLVELDTEATTWTIPGERSKSGRTHRVPLLTRGVGILALARGTADTSGPVSPPAVGEVTSSAKLTKALRDRRLDCVPHGFWASFRVCCGDTGVAREVAEATLAHAVRDKVEAANARATLFERRREAMVPWGGYLNQGRG